MASLRQQAAGLAVCGELHGRRGPRPRRADPLRAMKLTISTAEICSEVKLLCYAKWPESEI